MSTASIKNTDVKTSLLRSAFRVALVGAGVGAVVVAGIAVAGYNGFDRAVAWISYLTIPSGAVFMPIFESLWPTLTDDPTAGLFSIAFCAWVQVSIIAASVIGIGYWLATGAFYNSAK